MQTARKLNLQTVLNRERMTASKRLRNNTKVAGETDQEESPLPMETNGHNRESKQTSAAAEKGRATIKRQRARHETI